MRFGSPAHEEKIFWKNCRCKSKIKNVCPWAKMKKVYQKSYSPSSTVKVTVCFSNTREKVWTRCCVLRVLQHFPFTISHNLALEHVELKNICWTFPPSCWWRCHHSSLPPRHFFGNSGHFINSFSFCKFCISWHWTLLETQSEHLRQHKSAIRFGSVCHDDLNCFFLTQHLTNH